MACVVIVESEAGTGSGTGRLDGGGGLSGDAGAVGRGCMAGEVLFGGGQFDFSSVASGFPLSVVTVPNN